MMRMDPTYRKTMLWKHRAMRKARNIMCMFFLVWNFICQIVVEFFVRRRRQRRGKEKHVKNACPLGSDTICDDLPNRDYRLDHSSHRHIVTIIYNMYIGKYSEYTYINWDGVRLDWRCMKSINYRLELVLS